MCEMKLTCVYSSFLLNNVLLLNYIQMKPMQMISDNLAS